MTRPHDLGAATAALVAIAACLAGGCGTGSRHASPPSPRLPAKLASRLALRSDEVARRLNVNDGCGALAAAHELQRETVAAINARRVPPRLQEPLSAAANDLVFRIRCVPPRPEATTVPAEGAGEGKEHGHGHGKGHGRGHGKGHGKGKGKHGGKGGED